LSPKRLCIRRNYTPCAKRSNATGKKSRRRKGAGEDILIEAMLTGRYGLPLDSAMADVSPNVMAEYRDRRLRAVKPSTVIRELSIIGAMLEIARKEWGWIATNPIHDIRKPSAPHHRERVIQLREIRAMLRSMGYVPRQRPRSVTQAAAYCFLLARSRGCARGTCAVWNGKMLGHLRLSCR
jgi:hypothetical protein